MARQGNQTRENNTSNRKAASWNDGVSWVNYTLTVEHKKLLDEMIAKDANKLEAEMQTLAEEGYRWSINWDSYAGCWSCTMYNREANDKNAGKMMSSRSKSWYKALLMCLYKHVIVFQGEWMVDPDPERDWEG